MAIFGKKNQKEEKKVEISGSRPIGHRGSALFMKQPWVTEKAGALGALGKYIFVIDKKANKSEVKKAVERIYNVKVEDVNVANIKGKAKRLGRSLGKTSGLKKAIVTLKKGQKIDIMPT